MRDGIVEIVLVTSRTRGRWIIPKGKVEDSLGTRGSARREAYEEAGVRGKLYLAPIGTYVHGVPPEVQHVEVFLMKVERQLASWPEANERERRWVPIASALGMVDEEELKPILQVAAELLH